MQNRTQKGHQKWEHKKFNYAKRKKELLINQQKLCMYTEQQVGMKKSAFGQSFYNQFTFKTGSRL